MLAQLLMSAITRSKAGAARSRTGGHRSEAGGHRSEAGGHRTEAGIRSRAVGNGAVSHERIAREIMTHREAIALYQDEVNGTDPQLRVFARRILPQLKQHLAMLESLKSENFHARRR